MLGRGTFSRSRPLLVTKTGARGPEKKTTINIFSKKRCKKNMKTIVCIGDSITQQGFGNSGWVAGLADTYQRRADIVDRGFSGYNTRNILHLFPFVLDSVRGG